MTFDEHRLRRHLAIAVLVKLAALVALWGWFVRDARVSVDADRAASHMVMPASRSPVGQGALQ